MAILKPIGIVIAIGAGICAAMWVIVTLGWKAVSENSTLAKLAFLAFIILAACIGGGLGNYLYQNTVWRG